MKKLEDMTLTKTDVDVLMAYAECNKSGKSVGEKLHMRKCNVYYHLEKIQRVTKLNPRIFYDLVKLVQMYGGEHEETYLL